MREQARSVSLSQLQQQAEAAEATGDVATALARWQALRAHLESAAGPGRQRLAQIDAVIARLQERLEQRDQDRHADLRRRSLAEALQRRDGQQQRQQTLRDHRLQRIRDLRERGHNDLALEQARVLMDEMPDDPELSGLYAALIEAVHRQRQRTTGQRQEFLKQEVAERVSRSLIPEGFDAMPVFPEDWQERIAGRQSSWRQSSNQDHSDLRNRLAQRLSLRVTDQQPAEVLDQLASASGVSMIVGPGVRAAPASSITLQASNMRLDHILDWVASQAQVHWRIDRGAVVVSDELEEGPLLTRIYDLATLLYVPPDFSGMELGLQTEQGEGIAVIDAQADDDVGMAAEDLLDLIRLTLGEARWQAPGVALRTFGTQLLVTATGLMHEQLQEFLRQLHASEELLVHVQARWVTMRRSFVEDIGVRLVSEGALNFGAPPQGLFPDQPGDAGLGWVRDTSQGRNVGMVQHELPDFSMALDEGPLAGLAGRGLTLQVGWLGAWQVASIFQAVQERTDV
ncbi:MAG: hypothetical protein ACOCXA_07960, partial [Planctomycetota bacterium]